jgi:hypothetical protein
VTELNALVSMEQGEHTDDDDDRLRAEGMIHFLREKFKQLRQQAMMTPEEVAQAFRDDHSVEPEFSPQRPGRGTG